MCGGPEVAAPAAAKGAADVAGSALAAETAALTGSGVASGMGAATAGAMMPAAILPAGEFVSAGTMASSAPGVVGTVMEPAASMFAPTMLERAATLGSNIMGGGDTIINNVGSSLAKQGVAAGMNALSSRGEEKAAKSFNEQLAGLIQRSNNQTYGAAQAVPLNTPANTPPGLTGTRGAVDPSATVAASGRPAPSMGAGAAPVSGTPNAPAAPRGSQDGAVKLGTRPRMYAG